jgi:hypothetical protein
MYYYTIPSQTTYSVSCTIIQLDMWIRIGNPDRIQEGENYPLPPPPKKKREKFLVFLCVGYSLWGVWRLLL